MNLKLPSISGDKIQLTREKGGGVCRHLMGLNFGLGLAVVLAFFGGSPVRGAVLLNASFSDGDRLTQNLPNSARWYSGGASNNVSAASGALVFTGDSGGSSPGSIHGGGLAYFTAAGKPISLAVGQSLTLSFNYSSSQSDSGDWDFGFGLYNSGGLRIAADNSGFNNSIFNKYTGYEAAGILGPDISGLGRYKIASRTLSGNNLLASSFYTIFGGNVKQIAGTNAGQTYAASLTLSAINATNLVLTSVIAGQTLTRTNVSGVVTNFDTVGIFAPGAPGTFTVDNVAVTVSNIPPVANVMTVPRTAGMRLLIALSDLATNWTDIAGNPVTLTGIAATSTNGATLFPLNLTTNLDGSYVITDSTFIGYVNNTNVNDQFTYTISDGKGGTSVGYVNIVVSSSPLFGQATSIAAAGDPAINVSFAGHPGYSYSVQRSTNLVSWKTIWTTNAPPGGLFSYGDNFGDLGGIAPSSAYYRLAWTP